jgi:hypothetical protein
MDAVARQPDRLGRQGLLAALRGLAIFAVTLAAADARSVDFSHDVVPILRVHCGKCHTGDAKQGGFSMNTREALLAGGDSGTPGFVEGRAGESEIIARITDASGKVVAQAKGAKAGDEAARAIDARNAFIMDSMMRDVVRKGTATQALRLRRSDLAGKTGTTNDSFDAWFVGYSPKLAGAAWVGFDQPHKLGDRETGGGLALPIWINYMAVALSGVPDEAAKAPPGVVQINGEWYLAEVPPGKGIASLGGGGDGGLGSGTRGDQVRDQLF